MKQSLVKWLVIICVVGWAAHNPAEVGTDVHTIIGAGQSLVGSMASGLGSAASGVSTGGH